MKRIVTLCLISLLSGCSLVQYDSNDWAYTEGTTTVDAVEGDKSQDTNNDDGLIDSLNSRVDPVAGDPAWAPIHPKNSLSIMRQKPGRYLVRLRLTAYMMILNPDMWEILSPSL